MNISERLRTVCRMVTPGGAVCDVGCDHALTDIALLSEGRVRFALASDVRKGPLQGAERNIAAAGLSREIKTILADGVPAGVRRKLPCGMPAALIVTGMGGELMAGILTRAGEDLAAFDELVLSPQSDLARVRYLLTELGFVIADEEMLREDGKFYTVMRAVRGEGGSLTPEEALFGPVLMARKHPVLREYLFWRRGILEEIAGHLRDGGRGIEDRRWAEVAAELAKVNAALKAISDEQV